MTESEYQESYAIAEDIARKIHKIADKTGVAVDEVVNMTIDLFAKAIQEDEK